ncbi:hypothetical protein [Roseateles sp. DAIF2]|uniref:hypothetical protein n=1 Tax=Roseateles sp. DAIF2 TaxID=2714952 RepID=UPI00352FF401
MAEAARADFPRSMGKVPVLLPTQHAGVRNRLDQWFERHGLRPRIAGEFEYAALLAASAPAAWACSRPPSWCRTSWRSATACSASAPATGWGAFLRDRHRQAGGASAGAPIARCAALSLRALRDWGLPLLWAADRRARSGFTRIDVYVNVSRQQQDRAGSVP